MVDVAAIVGMVTGFNGTRQMLEAAVALRDQAKINDAVQEMTKRVSDAQNSLLQALADQAELSEKLRSATEALRAVEEWAAEAARYRLVDYGGGTYAYSIKEDCQNGEPYHRLCPTCFQAKRKSILQFQFDSDNGRQNFQCLPCNVGFYLGVARGVGSYRPDADTDWKVV